MRTESDWEHNYCKEQSLSVCFFLVFPLQPTFCDDLETCTNSVLLFALSVQVPFVSCWLWQTMFLLASRNLVCQSQHETQGTWIDSGKRSTEFVQVSKSSQKVGGSWKNKKKAHREEPLLAIVAFSDTFCSHFFSTVHMFNLVVHFFSHFFCLLASLRKQEEAMAEQMNNRIKNVNGREKDENTMWLRTQLLQGTVPLGALFCFFPSVTFLWWFGDLYKICTPFPLVNASSSSLQLILANQIFAFKQKLGLPKSTGETRNLHWQ